MSQSFYRFGFALPIAIAIAPSAALLSQPSAQALSFRFDFDSSVSDDFQAATQEAASLWSDLLKDDVVVDLRVEYEDLSGAGDVLAGIKPGKVKVKYEDYVQALLQDSISTEDFQGLSSLQLSSKGQEALQEFQAGGISVQEVDLDSKEFSFLSNRKSGRPNAIDNNGSSNNKQLMLTTAQSKALGFSDPSKRGLDGIIKLNSNIDWDLDSSDGIDSDKYDVSTVLQHEIAHALGIVSGVDEQDFLNALGSPSESGGSSLSYLTPIDLFRYSEKSADLGVMDLTLGGDEKFFSLDGGQSAMQDENGQAAYFSTGSKEAGGDGYTGSHWKASSNPLGITNPILNKGQSIDISQLDLALLDSVGWDLEDNNLKRAAAIGLDWTQLTQDLASDRQVVKDDISKAWGNDIPALDAALSEASFELENEFRQQLQDEFNELTEKLEGKDKEKDRRKEIDKFYEKVEKVAGERNESLSKLPEEILKTDEKVRSWLQKSPKDLAKELEKADGETMNRLSNIIKASPSSERDALEQKLEDALSQFAPKPNKLVKELLDSSGPSNPIRWGHAYRFSFWWQKEAPQSIVGGGDDDISALDSTDSLLAFTAAPEEQDATDIPEPSSVLALFGIAVLGRRLTRKHL